MKSKKMQIIQSIVLTIIISIAFVFLGAMYIREIKTQHTIETENYLFEITKQSKEVIKTQINSTLQTVNAMSSLIEEVETFNIDNLLTYLKEEKNSNLFISLGFIDLNGMGHFIGHNDTYKNIDLSNEDYIKKALNGQFSVSDTIKYTLYDEYINCYAVPIFNKDKIIGVLCAVMKNEVFENILSISSFYGQGFSFVINKNGEVITHSSDINLNHNINNIFDLNFDNQKTFYQTKNNITEKVEGMFTYISNGEKKLATYMPIGVNDWYIVNVVPKASINQNFNKVIKLSIVVVIIAIIMFIFLVLHINRIEKNSKENIAKLIYYDKLTGAFNKNKFTFEAKNILKKNIFSYALIAIDINNFKFINELFGYNEGNFLLKHISNVLSNNLNENEFFFRDSADKFGFLMKYENEAILNKRLFLIMQRISEFMFTNNQKYNVTVSSGINLITNQDNMDFDLLIDQAFLALTKAKGGHVNKYAFYDEELHKKIIQRSIIENNMQSALENHEFIIYLQPKYDLNTQNIVGAEALVRWKTPEQKIIPPNSFIPIFEKNGFITKLDMYVLNEICKVIKNWTNKGYKMFPISVNQSRIHLYNDSYLEQIKQIIEERNISAEMIILEVTENIALENNDNLKNVIDTLHKIGFTISMDDFGSGYSSLNVLKDVPIDELKLDKMFLAETGDINKGKKIIAKIIELAKNLCIKTVSEGVETQEQAEFLKEIGCDIAQGFYFAKPIPIYDFEKLAFGKTFSIES